MPLALGNPWVAAPLAGALLVLLVCGWRAEMLKRFRRNNARAARLPDGAVIISTEGLSSALGRDLVGGLMLVAIGTFGVNQALRFLTLLAQCGLERLVGSVLIVEHDAQIRRQFRSNVPPLFADGRVVYGCSAAFAGGFANQPIDRVMDCIEIWGEPIEQAARTVIDVHLRRNESRSPSEVLVFQSLGGQAPAGVPAVATIRERFEESLTVCFTALPKHTRLRERWGDIKSAYESYGCWGWVLTDNLGADPVTADYGMVAVPLALSSATHSSDQSARLNNTLALALTQEPGAVLVYQVVADSVVGLPFRPDPSAPPTAYYTYRQPLTERTTKGLRKLRDGRGIWSADLPVGEKDAATFDIVLTSIGSADLTAVEDAVTVGSALRVKYAPHIKGRSVGAEQLYSANRENYERIFASITTTVDPVRPICPIVLVRLVAVTDGASIVPEIVKVPRERRLLSSGSVEPERPTDQVPPPQSLRPVVAKQPRKRRSA